MPWSICMQRHHQTTVVTMGGEIDLTVTGHIDRQLAAAVRDGGATGTIVDLSAVTFIDSTGITALLKGRRLADAAGKQYRVRGARSTVRRVLKLCDVWDHLCEGGS